MRSKRPNQNRKLLPLYIVQFAPTTPLNVVYAIKHLNYQKIEWQSLKKQDDILQCKKCQRFGHTATNCNLLYRCVKCANSHEPGECTVTEEIEKQNIYCINCKQTGHPASYKGCPIYQTMIERLKKRIEERRKHQSTAKPTPKMFDSMKVSKENGTFAQMMQGGPAAAAAMTTTTTTINSSLPPQPQLQQQQQQMQNDIKILADRMDKMTIQMQQQNEQMAQLMQIIAQI